MRSKISTDILQKSGLIATEVGYAELYINDEYMGLLVQNYFIYINKSLN